jgi:hypothetical protein
MNTKPLLGLVAGIAVTGFAASAQAGVSVGFSFGIPVQYAPRVVYAAPRYSSPVVYCPPPVRYCPPPVVYVAPRYERHYDYRDYRGHDRDRRSWSGHDRRDNRGSNRGGRR